MEQVLEILKYILPSVIVFLTAYLLIRSFHKKEYKRLLAQYRANNQQLITPLRLQAYERLILFLERITPDSLIVRLSNSKLTAQQFQSELLRHIRSEYEHNISQQLYVSSQAWTVVKNAKENTIKVINLSGTNLKPDSSSRDYSQAILEKLMESEKPPTHVAIEFLKSEMKQFF